MVGATFCCQRWFCLFSGNLIQCWFYTEIDECFKEYDYERKIAALSVNSRATGHMKSSSTPNDSAANETSSSLSDEPLEMLQDNARYISHDNSNTPDTQGLVVATLVERNRNFAH